MQRRQQQEPPPQQALLHPHQERARPSVTRLARIPARAGRCYWRALLFRDGGGRDDNARSHCQWRSHKTHSMAGRTTQVRTLFRACAPPSAGRYIAASVRFLLVREEDSWRDSRAQHCSGDGIFLFFAHSCYVLFLLSSVDPICANSA